MAHQTIQTPNISSTQPVRDVRVWQNYFKDLINKSGTGYTPTNVEIEWMRNLGLIQKTTTSPSYGGGGYSGYRGYRRGGGGGSRTVRSVQQGERMPAFASGQGGFGLVNWRL